jgi:outer membrane protein assembly factor BamE (lipoprotein component of BamABCDE complex)
MRQRTSAAVLIGAAVLILCGCVVPKAFKSENSASLKPGMSAAEVQAKMGKPMGIETKSGTETWTYDWHDPISSRYERIELHFQNGVYKDMSKTSPPSHD